MDQKRFLSNLGLCRRAGKLCAGHDEVKASVRKRRACLLIFASDASERLVEELSSLPGSPAVVRTALTSGDISSGTGKRAAVYSVTDSGFSKLITASIQQED